VEWEVEYTDEFENWWESLNEEEQESVATCILLLEARGPMLAFPFSSGIEQSRHSHMRGVANTARWPSVPGPLCL
jgi:hypothetical protein